MVQALIIEDDVFYASLFERQIKNYNCLQTITWESSPFPLWSGANFDLILISDSLLENAMLGQLFHLKMKHPKTPIVVFTQNQNKDIVEQYIKMGAQMVIFKNRYCLSKLSDFIYKCIKINSKKRAINILPLTK